MRAGKPAFMLKSNPMKVLPTPIEGVHLIELDRFTDDRGSLTKAFTETALAEHSIPTHFPEHFYSVSRRGVIRGMHAQRAHTECGKFIYTPVGRVLDVVLDMRPDSLTYQQFFKTELSGENHTGIYVPNGCMHGFLSQEENTHTVYFQTKMRDPEFECGIRFDSFGMDWGEENPIVSERDRNLPTMEEFASTTVPVLATTSL